MTLAEWHKKRKTHALIYATIPQSDFQKESSRIYQEVKESGGTKEQKNQLLGARMNVLIEDEHKLKKSTVSQEPELSDAQCKLHYEHATSLALEAGRMFHDQSLFGALREVLGQCGNIEGVDLTIANAVRVSTVKSHQAFRRGLTYPFGDSNQYKPGVDAMAQLVLAAAAIRYSPRQLRLGELSHYILSRRDVALELRDFFRGVEELEWVFSTPYLDENCTSDVEELASILMDLDDGILLDLTKSATRLRQLYLDLPHDEEEWLYPTLSGVVGDHTWRELTHIHLSGFEASSTELSNLLLRHADTLSYVYLGNVDLTEGDWPQCFASFAGKLPGVKQIELRARFSEHDGEVFCWFGFLDVAKGNKYAMQVSEYLIAGGEECPARPDSQESEPDSLFDWSDDEDELVATDGVSEVEE